jgi:hypothetical protein
MIDSVMSDDRPNPLSDVAKGLGLLFRAARTVVGRAIENVAATIEREVLGKKPPPPKGPAEPKDKPEPPPSSST